MDRERIELDPNLQKAIADARTRIDRKLGVPAHETSEQVGKISRMLFSVGAVESRTVIVNGQVQEEPVITFGMVSPEFGFFGSIRSDGIMRFGPKEHIGDQVLLNLDNSIEIHQIPDIQEGQMWRTTLEWGQLAMGAVTQIAEAYQVNISAAPIKDDTNEGRAVRFEMGVQHEIAPRKI